jgi:hypothetical protein
LLLLGLIPELCEYGNENWFNLKLGNWYVGRSKQDPAESVTGLVFTVIAS